MGDADADDNHAYKDVPIVRRARGSYIENDAFSFKRGAVQQTTLKLHSREVLGGVSFSETAIASRISKADGSMSSNEDAGGPKAKGGLAAEESVRAQRGFYAHSDTTARLLARRVRGGSLTCRERVFLFLEEPRAGKMSKRFSDTLFVLVLLSTAANTLETLDFWHEWVGESSFVVGMHCGTSRRRRAARPRTHARHARPRSRAPQSPVRAVGLLRSRTPRADGRARHTRAPPPCSRAQPSSSSTSCSAWRRRCAW